MRNASDVSSVGVLGQYPPLNWNEPIALDDADGDSVYSGVVSIDIPYDKMQFKFVLNNSVIELFNQDNRLATFKDQTQVTYKAVFDQPNQVN